MLLLPHLISGVFVIACQNIPFSMRVCKYDIVYKQAVTTEDIYLQMGNKTPTTASCEEMVVKIKLPDTKLADVELDVKNKFLDCRTPKYKLGLHLPHPVDHKSGKAEWDGKKETLIVTLRIVRDFDFMNF
ncbi:hypothetical protein ACJMK2_030985 [Sinanodonta woodiana]|uniref:PIH1D1/2/3 CS-like domain-containing protein n=1 Tax=Sinanodonta woodiana TaxID=1069815 RepID=A0ABD3WXF1_SINWO